MAKTSSSFSSGPSSEHSHLHKLTPFSAILHTLPRRAVTKVLGLKMKNGAMSSIVDLPSLANPLEDDRRLLEGCAEWSCGGTAIAWCPNRISRLFAITEATGG